MRERSATGRRETRRPDRNRRGDMRGRETQDKLCKQALRPPELDETTDPAEHQGAIASMRGQSRRAGLRICAPSSLAAQAIARGSPSRRARRVPRATREIATRAPSRRTLGRVPGARSTTPALRTTRRVRRNAALLPGRSLASPGGRRRVPTHDVVTLPCNEARTPPAPAQSASRPQSVTPSPEQSPAHGKRRSLSFSVPSSDFFSHMIPVFGSLIVPSPLSP